LTTRIYCFFVIRLTLKSLFEKIGAEVLELSNAEDLFQDTWRYHNLDLIFLDIDLPGMNGMTALIKLKETPKWNGFPIIMLTSHAAPALVKQDIHCGIHDYIIPMLETMENLSIPNSKGLAISAKILSAIYMTTWRSGKQSGVY